MARPYIVLPTVVGPKIVGDLALNLLGQVEKGLGHGELAFDILNCDTMIHQSQEPGGLGGLDKLFGNLIFAVLKI